MLTRQNFNGIKLTTIHEYIDLLNSRVNANIDKTNNWQSSVSHLRTYLNSHNINTVSKESINNYIDDRLNVNIHVNELFDTLEDDNTIDKLICHAIKSGIDINDYNTVEEDEYISQLYI